MHLVLEVPAAGKSHRHAFRWRSNPSSSLTLPPGWMAARTRLRQQSSHPQRKERIGGGRTFEGKAGFAAFQTAIRELSTRDIWPAPRPKVRSSPA